MRIALVAQEYPPETAHGGIGTQTYLKAHGLASRGHEVHVVAHSVDGQRRETHDGLVRVLRIPGFDGHMAIHTDPVRWLTYSALVAAAVQALHAQAPLDLVDFPEWASEGYIHLLNQAAWSRIPTVIHLHGPLVMFAHTLGWPEVDSELYRVGTAMEATCLRLADRVFSSSTCSTDWCAQHYGLERQLIPTLHTGVDTRLFAPRALPRERGPTIVFAGKIARTKGVEVLLEAACTLARTYPGLRLRMLGRGDDTLMRELRNRAQGRGLPGLLELAGFVDRHQLPDHLARADVFAAPSIYEGGPGFVYLEAMACGIPVIACSGSGASEVVRPGENGLLVPPGDVEALTTALDELLGNSERRLRMGRRARDYAVTEADSALCLARLERFYLEAARGCCSARRSDAS